MKFTIWISQKIRAVHGKIVLLDAMRNLASGRYQNVEAKLDVAIAAYRRLSNEDELSYLPELAIALSSISLYQAGQGLAFEKALKNAQEAMVIYRRLAGSWPHGSVSGLAVPVFHALGSAYCVLRKFAEGSDAFRELLQIQRLTCRPPEEVAITLTTYGKALSAASPETSEVRSVFQEALRLLSEPKLEAMEEFDAARATILAEFGGLDYRTKNLDEAQTYYERAAEIQRKPPQRGLEYDLLESLHVLGIIHREKKERVKARGYFEEVLKLAPKIGGQANQDLMRRTLHQLAELLCDYDPALSLPDYRQAHEYLTRACFYVDWSRGKLLDRTNRQQALAADLDIFEAQVRHSAEWWQARREEIPASALIAAVQAAENMRARQLLDHLAETGNPGGALGPPQARELRHLRDAIDAQRGTGSPKEVPPASEPFAVNAVPPGALETSNLRIHVEGRPVNRPPSARSAIALMEENLARRIGEVRAAQAGGPLPPACAPSDVVAFCNVIPHDVGTVLVQFVIGQKDSFALLVFSERHIVPVKLPGLTSNRGFQLAGLWKKAYTDARDAPAQKSYEMLATWNEAIERLLTQVATVALHPVIEALCEMEVRRLIICPHQALHVFPLHACKLVGGQLLAERFEVSYTPSFSLLHRCGERRRQRNAEVDTPGILLLDDRTLPFSAAEVTAVGQRCRAGNGMKVERLQDGDATRPAFICGIFDARVTHYARHTSFNDRDPLSSGLLLEDEVVTLRDIYTRVLLQRNELTVLNSCESGMLVPHELDDYQSFTTGFLFAGASCVISTLWSIADLPSALIMDAFYELWPGLPPAAALREAQNRVRRLTAGEALDGAVTALTRNLPKPAAKRCHEAKTSYVGTAAINGSPFASPVHWAAFTCNGYGFGSTVPRR